MSIVKKLVEFGVIEEFNDWAKHFLAGSKGQVKTDSSIIEFVQNLLSQQYSGDSSKVNNCKLAPWIVNTARTLGLDQISDTEINKFKIIIDWFKDSGTEVPIKSKDLNAAYDYVLSKQPKNKENPSQEEPDDENAPHLEAEKAGRIRRIGTVNDGSKRIWVEVVDHDWLEESGELNSNRKWGINCQSERQHGFLSPTMLNVQLIGPPKGNSNGPWSTQMAIAGIRAKKTIKEVKQEDNQLPGTQKTSAGYNDADERVVEFLCYNSFAKENFKVFTDYDNSIPSQNTNLRYGGSVFLIYLMQNKVALFNKLVDLRPDILENNQALILQNMGQEWFDEREMNIDLMVTENPEKYLQIFERIYKRFGDDAVKLLVEKIDLIDINKKNPDLILSVLSSLIGRVPTELFIKLFKEINLVEYISSYKENFKNLVRFSSELKEYKPLFDYLVVDNPNIVMQAFGKNVMGVYNFLNFASSPNKREHQDAKYDPVKEEFFRYKDEPYRNPDGSMVLNPDGTRRTYRKLVMIPDDLKVMKQQDRKKFLEKNKELIKSWIKGTDFEKELHFTRFLVKEMSPQESKKIFETGNLKQNIIEYYNQKYLEYKKDAEKGEDFLRKKYGVNLRDSDNKVLYKKAKPGIIEFYESFKVGKPSDRKIPLNELFANFNTIKNYYALISNQQDKSRKKIDGFIGFLNLYKQNGAPDEEVLKLIDLVDKSEFKSADILEFFYSKTINILDDRFKTKIFNKVKPMFDKFGYQGKKSFEDFVKKISTIRYNVNSGDLVLFLGNENYREKYKLSDKKHRVIDVRNIYKNDNSNNEEKTEGDVIEYNGEVLVAEDLNLGGMWGENIWVPASRFRINKEYLLDGQSVSLNESIKKIEFEYEKLIKIIHEAEKKETPKYSAIFLDEESKYLLSQIIDNLIRLQKIGNDWQISADHVTINMGPIYDKSLLWQNVAIKVEGIAINEMVATLKVSVNKDIDFSGRTPHITLAFNKNEGARPVMSNEIKNWEPFRNIVLKGKVKEFF